MTPEGSAIQLRLGPLRGVAREPKRVHAPTAVGTQRPMAWSIVGGPRYVEGPDAAPYLAQSEWDIERGSERRTVRIFYSPDLSGMDEEVIDAESYLAASLQGRSAFEPHLQDPDPPTRYAITREGVRVLGTG